MVDGKEQTADAPAAQDYRQLTKRADLLIGILEDVQRHTRRMRWWSVRIAVDVTTGDGIAVATNRLINVLKEDYDPSLIYLGGVGAVDHKSWQVHAVAGAGVTFDQYREIADTCARLVKSLGIPGSNRSTKEVFAGTPGPSSSEPEVFAVTPTDDPSFYTPGLRVEDVSECWYAQRECMHRMLWVCENFSASMKVCDYLSSLPKRLGNLPRDVPPDVSYCMAIWFSFLWENAEELGVVTTEGVGESRTGEALLTHDPSECFLVPYRTIENGICEASMLALQFLRQKAVERIKLLEDVEHARTDLTTVPQPRDKSGPGQPTTMPADIISAAVAVKDYCVSRATLRRAVEHTRLRDYRPKGHSENAPLQLSRAEVAAIWPRRGL